MRTRDSEQKPNYSTPLCSAPLCSALVRLVRLFDRTGPSRAWGKIVIWLLRDIIVFLIVGAAARVGGNRSGQTQVWLRDGLPTGACRPCIPASHASMTISQCTEPYGNYELLSNPIPSNSIPSALGNTSIDIVIRIFEITFQ